MIRAFRLLGLSAACAGLAGLACPVSADVTAAGLWDTWRDAAASYGKTLTPGSRSESGGVLTLTDVAVDMEVPEGRLDATIPQITLAEQGDGTVLITMSPDLSLHLATDPAEGEAVEMTLALALPGFETVASGDPAETAYGLRAPSLTMTLDALSVAGTPTDTRMILALSDLAATTRLGQGDPGQGAVGQDDARRFEGTFGAATATLDVSGTDSDGSGGTFALAAAYSGLEGASSGTLDGLAALNAPPTGVFSPGAELRSSLSHTGGSYSLRGVDPEDGAFSIRSATASGEMSFTVDDGSLTYEGEAAGLDVGLSGDTIPLPEVTASLDEMAFGLTVPLTETDAPRDLGLLLNLTGLSISDAIWSMLDPGAVLPRDPATLLIDLAGRVRLLRDPSDPATGSAAGSDTSSDTGSDTTPPGELHALDIKALKLSIAGADLTGSGAFTFDNEDLATFGGFPAPDGSVELSLEGGNALLDKLVQLGLLPQDQAMGARMMLGLFARSTGEDRLESTIEITPDGGVSANGQRLR